MPFNNMRKFLISIILFVLLSPLAIGFAADNGVVTPSEEPFTVIFLGSKSYSDTDIIVKNIRQIAGVRNFSTSVSSQNHTEYIGLYNGDPKKLVDDISGLSIDRFDVQSRNDRNLGTVITLRKIKF